MKFIPDTRRVH